MVYLLDKTMKTVFYNMAIYATITGTFFLDERFDKSTLIYYHTDNYGAATIMFLYVLMP